MNNKKHLEKHMNFNVKLIKFHNLNPFAHPAPEQERRLYQNPRSPVMLSSSRYSPPASVTTVLTSNTTD